MTTSSNAPITDDSVLRDGNPGLTALSDPRPGLRVFLAHKRAAFLALRARAEATPPTGPNLLSASAEAVSRSGVRRIRIRDFQILSDSPEDFAGYELGPSSPELQLGVLSSCLAHTFTIHAASLQIPLDSIRVEVTGELEPRRGTHGFENAPIEPHNIAYIVHLSSPAAQEHIDHLFAVVQQTCPIVNLLQNPQQLSGSVVLTPSKI
ncbi:OsmC family protein (plasmid) [Rhodococcus globerulus]|uniref:OsmC family protein n=1 Tax=Rhodococcus globerulus TaxID=33008 RepID=UPI0039EC65FB